MNPKYKKNLINLLKFAFAGAIIFYMIHTGKLDLAQIAQIAHKKFMILKVVLTLFGVYTLAIIRWHYLLLWQGISVNLRSTVRISCIGLFFNSFMPGALGGDLIKAYYVAKENKDYRTRAITTILIDRILGFETLMIVAFVALLINYKTMLSNPNLQAISSAIGFYILCSFVAAIALFSRRIKNFYLDKIFRPSFKKIPAYGIFKDIYYAFHAYSRQKKKLLLAMLITIPLDILNIYMFYTIGREMGENLVSLQSYFTAVPVGLLMLTLPIAPAGIGVGQGAFYSLFLWLGASSGKIGATIITIYQLIAMSVNSCFVFVYLSNKNELKSVINNVKQEASSY